jgi:hypothetical protein
MPLDDAAAKRKVATFTFVQRTDEGGQTTWEVVHRGDIVDSCNTEAKAKELLAPLFDLDVTEVKFGRL